MAVKAVTVVTVVTVLLLAVGLGLPAAGQAGSAAAAKTDKPAAAVTARPPRVIADVKAFNLDRTPTSSAPNQMGAVSRGDKSSLVLCAPSFGLTSTTHPLFEWRVPQGSTEAATFMLLSDAGDVLYETDVSGSSLQYGNDAPPLQPGQIYAWKVSGRAMDKLPDAVRVEVQTKEERDKVQQQAGEPAFADPLSRAQVYLRNKLWYDTVAALEGAIRQHPERKDLVQQLQALYAQVVPACGESVR